MKSIVEFGAFWISAIVIALVFEVFSGNFEAYRWQNVLENILFAIAMLLTVPLFDSPKIKSFFINFYFVVFVLCLFLESAFFYLFGTIFTASSIYIFIQTNLPEAREFLGFYLDFPMLVFFLIFAILTFFYLRSSKTGLLSIRPARVKLMSGALFIGLLVFLKFSGIIVSNFPYLVLKAGWGYVEEQQKMADIHIDRPIGNFENVEYLGAENSLYVLIIGESTTSGHLGLYGYYRNTTPKLNEIKKELLVFKRVKSPHSFTIGALKEALTLNNFEKAKESSIVQLMNQAGFKTFWLSNQRPLGPYESLTTKIAQASDVVRFTNSAVDGGVTPYDGVLLSYFEKALRGHSKKKFIVLHILGTHMQYKNRYPDSYDFFNDQPKSNFADELAYSRINAYDNAVRYMDDFIRKVIEKTRKQNTSSFVLYFSDHGEEVYEDRYFAGHLESNPTQNMFKIPFILWRSEKYRTMNSISEKNIHAPYNTADFIFSWADLTRIDFAGMQPKKSIFSEDYQAGKSIE